MTSGDQLQPGRFTGPTTSAEPHPENAAPIDPHLATASSPQPPVTPDATVTARAQSPVLDLQNSDPSSPPLGKFEGKVVHQERILEGTGPDYGQPSTSETLAIPRRETSLNWFVVSLLSFMLITILYGIGQYIADVYLRNPIAGQLIGASALVVLATGLWKLVSEIISLRRLKNVMEQRETFRDIVARGLIPELKEHCQQVARSIAGKNSAIEKGLIAATGNDNSPERVLASFEKYVLKPADQAALTEIRSAIRYVAIGSVAARGPGLSALLALVCKVKMIVRVAQVYGVQPGIAATNMLLREVLWQSAVAAAADIGARMLVESVQETGSQVADLAAEAASFVPLGGAVVKAVGSIANKGLMVAAGNLGEGAAAAMLTARLGVAAMECCRPTEFLENKPTARNLLFEALRPGK